MASGRRLRPRPIVETAAETVARFRTVNTTINKGGSKERLLRKVPAPRYVVPVSAGIFTAGVEDGRSLQGPEINRAIGRLCRQSPGAGRSDGSGRETLDRACDPVTA